MRSPGLRVVGCPAEIGGIDVRRQPLLEAVHLVGADEMHLAGKRRLIAGAAQVVRIGRDVGGEFRGIVVDARAARELSGHEGGPRRRAERACRVGIREAHRALGQCLQMRRMKKVGRPVWKQRSVELVDHKDEDIGRAMRGLSLGLRGRESFSLRLQRASRQAWSRRRARDRRPSDWPSAMRVAAAFGSSPPRIEPISEFSMPISNLRFLNRAAAFGHFSGPAGARQRIDLGAAEIRAEIGVTAGQVFERELLVHRMRRPGEENNRALVLSGALDLCQHCLLAGFRRAASP